MSAFKSAHLTRMAEGQDCVACGADDYTTVCAHRNEYKARASGIDVWSLDLCAKCHQWYDQGPASQEEKRAFFNEHYPKQVLRWIHRGVLKLIGATP